MTEKVNIPVYHGGWMDVFWSNDSRLNVSAGKSVLVLEANLQAFEALAKQLIYFSCNNTLTGAHIHYDMFSFGKGFSGIPLTIAFSSDNKIIGNDLYDDTVMTVVIKTPQRTNSAEYCICPNSLRISFEDAVITGDENAFLFLAKQILSFRTASNTDTFSIKTRDGSLSLRKIGDSPACNKT